MSSRFKDVSEISIKEQFKGKINIILSLLLSNQPIPPFLVDRTKKES